MKRKERGKGLLSDSILATPGQVSERQVASQLGDLMRQCLQLAHSLGCRQGQEKEKLFGKIPKGCFCKWFVEGNLRALITRSRSHSGGDTLRIGLWIEQDRSNSLVIEKEDRSGSFQRKTKDRIDLYPLIQGTENFLCSWRNRRKSATLGIVGRDTE